MLKRSRHNNVTCMPHKIRGVHVKNMSATNKRSADSTMHVHMRFYLVGVKITALSSSSSSMCLRLPYTLLVHSHQGQQAWWRTRLHACNTQQACVQPSKRPSDMVSHAPHYVGLLIESVRGAVNVLRCCSTLAKKCGGYDDDGRPPSLAYTEDAR